MRRFGGWFARFLAGAAGAALLLFLIYQIPFVKFQLEWRLDKAAGIARGWLNPGDTLPTPASEPHELIMPTAMPSPTASPTVAITATPASTATPIPASVQLPAPAWEKQDWNNCGPATLAITLHYYGWEGDQYSISSLLKPDRGDKNVNVEELIYYVRTQAGWLQADYRVGGEIGDLKRFLAAGYPLMVEKGFILAEGDSGGGWTAHYLLLTGYDDSSNEFTAQDSYLGADLRVPYRELDDGWQAFNRVYILIYPPEEGDRIQELLEEDLDPEVNRQRALQAAQRDIEADPENAFAWFNLGTNLIYFERYGQAAEAYDNALSLGLPWRFTRYQFGPYIAYFNQGRFQDMIDLADATLARTPKAEESLLWRGWARYRLGETAGARRDFRAALAVNPNYHDAQYAIDFIGESQ
jgi:tetratricopeptide (TPR) repeat protein